VTTSFDVHEVRHRLKQLSDDGTTKLFENRDGVVCPACETPFDRLFITSRVETSFPENDGSRFCLVRDSGQICVFRH
jgi:hypothetical protein